MALILDRAALEAKAGLEVPTKALMEFLAEMAKGFIGHYQAGWAPLKPSTIADKTKKGFAPPDNPLLRTGDMRGSIDGKAEATSYGAEGAVGSESKIALYQEMGTSRGIPPRPFLATAMMHSQEKAAVLFGQFALKLLTR